MAHIVLIEDDPLLSEMYRAALINQGHTCTAALDGLTGLHAVQHEVPNLVLLDLMLPQLSGDQVLAQIRKTEACKDVTVVIMTNINESEAPPELKSLVFEQYIVKANTTLNQVVTMVNNLYPVQKPTGNTQ